ncbi:MAG TPA: hypothetical protein VGG03_24115 [Thermoanaerobaculia bacterium]|jgi:hypothetical protein
MDMKMRRERTALWLALGVFLVYFFTSSGGVESSDAVLRYRTAKSWIEGRGGVLPAELGWDGGAVLPDGRIYSFFGPLQSVLMVPFLLVARALPAGGTDPTVVETFAVSLGLFPLLSTAVIVLLYLALRRLGHSSRTSLLACLGIAFASLFWHYARMGQEESLVALGFAFWLYGAARLASGGPFPATLMALGALVALATRWASVPQMAVLFVATLALLRRHRERVRPADVALGAGLVTAGTFALLLYNHVRFGDWLQTGYGIWYTHYGLKMFQPDGYAGHLAALLASPYRGLLFYSPIVVAAIAGTFLLRPGTERLLGLTALAVLAAALLFFSAFHFWAGGHSWGPRFLASPQVLLAPALAALFARRPRSAWLVPALAALQLFSTVLPASTEEYVRYNVEQARPGHCTPWRFECSAVPQRIPRAVRAFANTVANRPGVTLIGRPAVAPEVVLSTSDYRTLYWWPVRIAFRLKRLPSWAALLVCLAGLGAAAVCLRWAWTASAAPSPA